MIRLREFEMIKWKHPTSPETNNAELAWDIVFATNFKCVSLGDNVQILEHLMTMGYIQRGRIDKGDF